jgi:hypothetical protein
MNNNVEARLSRLEAVEAIRALKMRYARLCDAGYPAQEISALFVEGAVWDGGELLGRFTGRREIEEFFASTPTRVPWALHYIVAGDIDLSEDAKSATGSWYLWQPMTFDNAAVWLMATYADEYLLTDEGWRYSNLTLNVQALTPATSDWLAERFINV